MILGSWAVLVAAPDADAKCAHPGTAISPAAQGRAGAVVPRDPTVYVFDPYHGHGKGPPAITAIVAHESISVDVEKVSENDAFATYRVRLETGTARHVSVQVEDVYGRVTSSEYRLVPSWTRGELPALRSARRVQDRWTCSHTDVWRLEMSPSRAVGYRVEYARTHAALERDPKVTVFPADMPSAFWRPRPGANPTIELGHANCFGHTVEEALMRGRIVARYAPLYPDGTTGPFSDPFVLGEELPDPPPPEPAEPEPPELPEPVVAAPIEPPPAPAPPPAPEAIAPHDASSLAWLLALGGAALALALLIGYAIRRRLVPPHH